MTASVRVACDHPGCPVVAEVTGTVVRFARYDLEKVGWRTAVRGGWMYPPQDGRLRLDFCPRHVNTPRRSIDARWENRT